MRKSPTKSQTRLEGHVVGNSYKLVVNKLVSCGISLQYVTGVSIAMFMCQRVVVKLVGGHTSYEFLWHVPTGGYRMLSRLGPGPNRTVLFGFIGSLRIDAGVAGLLGSRVYDSMMWPRKDGDCKNMQDILYNIIIYIYSNYMIYIIHIYIYIQYISSIEPFQNLPETAAAPHFLTGI